MKWPNAMATPPTAVRHIAGAERPPWAAYDADVVILALDRAEATVAAIRSALSQTGVSRYVIVMDQGSRPEALADLASAVEGRDDATLVTGDRNYGVPGGRNIGSAQGCGRIIVGLDNDAEFAAPDSLARLVGGFGADPELAAIGCRIVVDATGKDDLSSWGYPPALLARSQATFEAATFVGAGHAIRRAAWRDVGGYDARLFFCWEEYDFCLRAIARYWRVRYRGDIVVRHKVSPERRVTWSGDRWFHFVRNRLYIGWKSGESWLALAPRIAGVCV
jgi:GT2 family glycosyltransferase